MIDMSNICKIVLMWMPLFLIDDRLALPTVNSLILGAPNPQA